MSDDEGNAWRFVALGSLVVLLIVAFIKTTGAGIGNDRVTVSEPTVNIYVTDPAQVAKVMDVIQCEAQSDE